MMPRLMRAPADGELSACPLCGADRGTTTWSDGYFTHRLCAACGVSLGLRDSYAPTTAGVRGTRWKLVWERAV
ncbi:hypothetical protein [Streptomyces sp. NPDC088762]|uniref:hypothetical protein n=1 Tax=Streptomyces sp. NPDC088762 TaxID=3365891 RepID=UPI0038180361